MDLAHLLNPFPVVNPGAGWWDIEEIPVEEGSQYYNIRLRCRVVDWYPGLLVQNSLEPLRWLFQYIRQHYNYTRIRAYFQHTNNYELHRLRIHRGPMNHNFQFTRTNVLYQSQMMQVDDLAQAAYNRIQLMAAKYNDEDDDFVEQYVILVDIEVPDNAGGCGTGRYPQYFPAYFNDDFLYNPTGGFCAIKCLHYHFRNRAIATSNEMCLGFAREFNLPTVDEPVLYTDLAAHVADAWPGIRFAIVDLALNLKHLSGPTFDFDDTVVLLLTSNHYFYVKDLEALCRRHYGEQASVCFRCGRISEHITHQCTRLNETCFKCGKFFRTKQMRYAHKAPKEGYTSDKCPGCGEADFISPQCYGFHTKSCEAYKLWKEIDKQCREELRGKRIHCAGCGQNYYENQGSHLCYFDRYDMPQDPKYADGIYVFDFESMFSPEDQHGKQEHTVNYVVVKKLFDDDLNLHFDDIDAFASWLVSIADQEALVLAHNFRGYDGRLLLAKLVKNPDNLYCENFITAGSKLNSFRLGSLTFSDSLLHIAQPLDQFPKIFGLDISCKGFFPYDFNVLANQHYVGAIPPKETFRPNKMSAKRRDEFLRWYDEVKDMEYDFRKEMIKYCELDVEIMKQGLEVYIESSKQANEGIIPLESFTIASAAYRIWRTLHMPERTIAYYGQAFHDAARESLRGGRTDVRRLYMKWTPEQVFIEKRYGVYADVQSMYPYVQMTRPLPVGKPVRKYGSWSPGDFGIVKCDLLPPLQFQFHPAICVRDDETGRLVAPLKPLKNLYITSVEYEQALRQGYRSEKVHFVDVYSQSDELFKDYIRKFLKIKVEKSQDYPGDEKFEELRRMYSERCGIELEATNFENNPGLKQIAKLYLNSLWGKLCERTKIDYTKHLSFDEFLKLEEAEECGYYLPKLKLKLNDDSWFVRGQYTNTSTFFQDQKNHKKVSPAIGSFITMYGRQMLFEQMELLQKRVLYHDTDSIIYERIEGQYNIPLGKCLGDWEDELKGKPMIEFVALAPKTYSYRYLDDPVQECPEPYWEWQGRKYPIREVTKIKGVKQCFDTNSSIDFNTMLDLVNEVKTRIETEQLMFLWDQKQMKMETKWSMKTTSFKYGKGEVGADYFTYPPGVEKYWNSQARTCEQGDPIKV